MENLSNFTVINDKNLRGVLAPAKILTKELLEDILDLIEYSKPEIVSKINKNYAKIKKENLISGNVLKESLGL